MIRNKYSALLRRDLKNGVRDPMLMLIFIGSLLVIVLLRFALPAISDWIYGKLGYALEPYDFHIEGFLLSMVPLLIGSAVGLLILEEKDDRLVDCYAVTPLRKEGYLMYRLLLPVVLCALILLLSIGIHDDPAALTSLPLLFLVLEAPLYALFLASVASNKVEGLALSKFISLSVIVALCCNLAAAPWLWLGSWLPAFWPIQLYLSIGHTEGIQAQLLVQFLIGLIVHGLLLYAGFRRFSRQV